MYLKLTENLRRIIDEVGKIGKLLYDKGWAEGNAGNMSIRIDLSSPEKFEVVKEVPLAKRYINLDGTSYLVTGGGKRLRDIADSPEKNLCIGYVQRKKFIILWPKGCDFLPTSEFPSHLIIHQTNLKVKEENRVVLHTHPDELIALSHLSSVCDTKSLNDILWRMHPETYIKIRNGVGFVPYAVPSTLELAKETGKLVKSHQLILWEKHGILYTGESLQKGLDLIEIANKSAKIFLLAKSSSCEIKPLSDNELYETDMVFQKRDVRISNHDAFTKRTD